MKNTTGVAKRYVSLALAAVMALPLAGCKGKTNEGIQAEGGSAPVQTEAAGEKIVNIGVTSSLNTLNPLLMGGVEMNEYAAGLMFPPLTDLDKDMNFEGMSTGSVTAEDGSNFLVHIDDQAVWSDRTPVTTDDVIYMALHVCSPAIGNVVMIYYVSEGVGDDEFVETGADHVEGITKVDDKIMRFTTKASMSLITFKAPYVRYLIPLPKHVIENISEENPMSDPWFNKPDVASGPHRVAELDRDHYVAYEANKSYWKGVPKIDRLNIKIVEGSQLYAGLKSGEIGVTQNTMSPIPLEDYESVQSLENVNVSFGDLIINQSVFIRISDISDAKVRQVMLRATDRRQILDRLSRGNGGVSEGSLSPANPYFDESIIPVTYDPEKAKAFSGESGWDESKTIEFCIGSGDSTFVNAASAIVVQWVVVGIKADIQTMDISALPGNASKGDFDAMTVQYIYPPVDPYADVAWLLGDEGSWTEYSNDKANEVLSKVQLSSDIGKPKGLHFIIDKQVQEDVPVFSAYIIETTVAVNKCLTGVEPGVYGFLNHVEQWDIAQ